MATDAVGNEPIYTLPPELHPVVDHLVTEDDTPVDNVFSEKQQRLLTEPLHSSWTGHEGQRSFVAMSNVGLFFSVHRPPLVPDAMLSLDVEMPADPFPKNHRSYFVWEYDKLPDVVIEVVSNREGGEDTTKLAAYARIRIPNYVIYDPEHWLCHEVLRAYQLTAGKYQRIEEPIWFSEVGLGLRVWHGQYEDLDSDWLRWVDVDGTTIPTGRELAIAERERADVERDRADVERDRANAERERATAERVRAASEHERAERLAEQLRRAGIDPQNP
jgi:Uma2 family endonuclease